MQYTVTMECNVKCKIFRMLSSRSQGRTEKIVGNIKYLEHQVQRLINLNCLTKFRYKVKSVIINQFISI